MLKAVFLFDYKVVTCHKQNVVFICSVQVPKRWKVIHRDVKTRIFPSKMNCLQNNWQKNIKQMIALLLVFKAILGAEGLHLPLTYLCLAFLLFLVLNLSCVSCHFNLQHVRN